MKKVDIWMPIYLGDYIKDTRHLSLEEHGAYFLILSELWVKDGFIPLKTLPRIVGSPSNWEDIWDILKGFFDITDGMVSQKRLLKPITFTSWTNTEF